jgi:hypothetical protein
MATDYFGPKLSLQPAPKIVTPKQPTLKKK